jgi:hypothetical protein
MKYIDFKYVRSWQNALTPRREERYSALTLVSGAIYRVKIGAGYQITFHEDMKGARIFTLFFEGEISERETIPLGAPLNKYTETLSLFTKWGEDLEYEESLPERRIMFTGDYPSA